MVKIKYTPFGSVEAGGSWSNFDLGVSISKYWFTLSLGFVWLSVEF